MENLIHSEMRYLIKAGFRPVVMTMQVKGSSRHEELEIEGVKVPVYRTDYFLSSSFPKMPQTTSSKAKGSKSLFSRLKRYILKPHPYLIIPFINFPDPGARWLIQGYKAGKKIIEKENIDIIIGTNYPNTALIFGAYLAQKRNLPFICQFTEPWVKHERNRKGLKGYFNRKFERFVIENSKRVVFRKEVQIPSNYQERFSEESSGKFRQMPFRGCEFFKKNKEVVPQEEVKIISGQSWNLGASSLLSTFIEGLSDFVKEESITPSNLQVDSFGRWSKTTKEKIQELGLTEFINHIGRQPREEYLEALRESDALIVGSGERSLNPRRFVPSKTWEALERGVPVFALTKEGYQLHELIANNNLGLVANYESTEEVKEQLKVLYENTLSGERIVDAPDEFYEKYSRKKSLEPLIDSLREIT